MLLLGFGIAANAQTLLYQWAFTNVSELLQSSTPSYAISPGTGNLILQTPLGGPTAAPVWFTMRTPDRDRIGGGRDGCVGRQWTELQWCSRRHRHRHQTLILNSLFQFTVTWWVNWVSPRQALTIRALSNLVPRPTTMWAQGSVGRNHNGAAGASTASAFCRTDLLPPDGSAAEAYHHGRLLSPREVVPPGIFEARLLTTEMPRPPTFANWIGTSASPLQMPAANHWQIIQPSISQPMPAL